MCLVIFDMLSRECGRWHAFIHLKHRSGCVLGFTNGINVTPGFFSGYLLSVLQVPHWQFFTMSKTKLEISYSESETEVPEKKFMIYS
jgi:hypothetical protein